MICDGMEEVNIGGRTDWVSRRLEGTRRVGRRTRPPQSEGLARPIYSCEADQA